MVWAELRWFIRYPNSFPEDGEVKLYCTHVTNKKCTRDPLAALPLSQNALEVMTLNAMNHLPSQEDKRQDDEIYYMRAAGTNPALTY